MFERIESVFFKMKNFYSALCAIVNSYIYTHIYTFDFEELEGNWTKIGV